MRIIIAGLLACPLHIFLISNHNYGFVIILAGLQVLAGLDVKLKKS